MMTKAIIGVVALLVVMPVAVAQPTYYIDNTSPHFHILSGDWQEAQQPNAYNGDAHYIIPAGSTYVAAWQTNSVLIPQRTYDVYVWKFEHPFNNVVTTRATFRVYSAIGPAGPVYINQTTPGNGWIYLGRYPFNNDEPEGVLLSTRFPGVHIADAMKFVMTNWP